MNLREFFTPAAIAAYWSEIEPNLDPYVTAILERLFDDAAELIAAANVVPERMIFQLLFPVDGNVGIAINANGMDYTYNYDKDGSWKESNYIALTGGDMWSAADTADPFITFEEAKDRALEKTGANLTTAIMNKNTFNMMARTEAIKKRYLTTSGLSFAYLTKTEVTAAIRGRAA